jgi:hypothetical protein
VHEQGFCLYVFIDQDRLTEGKRGRRFIPFSLKKTKMNEIDRCIDVLLEIARVLDSGHVPTFRYQFDGIAASAQYEDRVDRFVCYASANIDVATHASPWPV